MSDRLSAVRERWRQEQGSEEYFLSNEDLCFLFDLVAAAFDACPWCNDERCEIVASDGNGTRYHKPVAESMGLQRCQLPVRFVRLLESGE